MYVSKYILILMFSFISCYWNFMGVKRKRQGLIAYSHRWTSQEHVTKLITVSSCEIQSSVGFSCSFSSSFPDCSFGFYFAVPTHNPARTRMRGGNPHLFSAYIHSLGDLFYSLVSLKEPLKLNKFKSQSWFYAQNFVLPESLPQFMATPVFY